MSAGPAPAVGAPGAAVEEPARRAPREGVALVAVCAAAALYLSRFALRGWIPHDEGLLAQSAERVLAGELPHRDFDEMYTGGLSLLHALAFHLGGVRLATIRLVLLAVSVAWVGVVYRVARRLAPPAGAALATALCLVWSVPNYFAALPTWYVLFCATFGIHALLRRAEGGGRGWLVLAGVWAGLGCAVKSVGVFWIAAAVLFLVQHERAASAERAGPRGRLVGAVAAGGVALTVLLTGLVRPQLGVMTLVQHVLPTVAVVAAMAIAERREGRGPAGPRLRVLARDATALAAGIALPIGALIALWAAHGALPELAHGLFVLPRRRFDFASYPLPPAWTLVAVVPYAVMLARGRPLPARMRRAAFYAVAIGLAVLLGLARLEGVYRAIWYALRPLAPVTAVVGVLALLRRPARADAGLRAAAWLVLTSAALVELVQYPYAYGVYFFYVAPLVVLATLAVIRLQPDPPRELHVAVALFALLFGAAVVSRGSVRTMGVVPATAPAMAPLALARAGISVPAPHAAVYPALVALVQDHSAAGDFIYAGPDCPEVYFLTARRNPTPTMYDFFEPDFGDPARRTARLLATLDRQGVAVVVLNDAPEFSGPMPAALRGALLDRYPRSASVPPFTVRWRP